MADKKDFMNTVEEAEEKINDKIREAVKKAEPTVEKVKEQVKPTVEKVKEQVKPTVDKMKEKAEPTVEKVKEKAEPTVKEVRKQVKKAGTTARKTAKKMTAPEVVCKIQYGAGEADLDDIVARAKAAYEETDPKTPVKDIKIYVKPEDSAAYYVINNAATGKVDIF